MKGIITLLALLAPSLHAAELTLQLQQCRSVASELQRLTCYDKIEITAANAVAQVSTGVSQMTAEETSTPAADFGLERKKMAQKAEAVEHLLLELKSAETNKLGLLVFTFTNGQVWRQASKDFFTAKEGSDYQVERGLLGAFYLKKVGTNRKVRVVREQ